MHKAITYAYATSSLARDLRAIPNQWRALRAYLQDIEQ